MSSNNKPSHLKALLRKNWIIWKRGWFISLLEILVPLFFALIIVAFRKASEPEHVPEATYYNNPNTIINLDGTLNNFVLSNYMKNCNEQENSGKVGLAPQSDPIIMELNNAFVGQGIQTHLFDSNAEIDAYTTRHEYRSTPSNGVCFAIIMEKNNIQNEYEYIVRYNISGWEVFDIPDTSEDRVNKISWQNVESFERYRSSGFLVVQNLLDNYILQSETSNSASIKTQIAPRTVEAYVQDDLAANLKGQTRLFLDLPLLLPYLRFMNGILREKEKKIREGMRIMGLRNSAFYFSWFITYFLIFTVISLVVTAALASQLFSLSSYGYVFLWHWEFSICLMALGFLITVFFSKAKVGNVAGFVIALFLGFFQSTVTDASTSGQLAGISFFPQTSMGISSDHMLTLEAAQLGLTSDTVSVEVNGYRMTFHYIIMAIDILIFFLLGSYLDQVLPSDFGIRKHPLFCLMRNKKTKGQKTQHYNTEEDHLAENIENFEQEDPALKAQDLANESIQVRNLRKVFSNNKVAVDGVDFNMYKSQIFTLLGHNGAGKTTTISMITGLLGPTQGTAKVFGMDVQDELEEIRKTMGVCPQHDILFDMLTVKEHLELYAVFKGVDKKDIPAEVEKIIEDIGLSDKRDYRSKNLSGGQKRKLSIGIAFIGGSKFILLDEPSSGMDTSARRKLWDMLKNYKHNRIVLLTTHFMDEADYLGDRIGIMADGKLKCLGSPLFLKTKFGIGYNLTLVKKDINYSSQPIKDLIKKHVPEGKVLSDVSAELAYQLPLGAVPKFKGLFDELDKQLEELKVSSYGISVTTLEEVFLSVAQTTTPDKHFTKSTLTEKEAAQEDLDDYDLKEHRLKGTWTVFSTHFSALVKKRVHYFRRDKKGLLCELLMPILMVIGGILIAKSAFGKEVKPVFLTDGLYGDRFQVSYNDRLPSNGPAIDQNLLDGFNTNYFNLVSTPAQTVPEFDQDVFDNQGKSLIHDTINVFSLFVQAYDDSTHNYEYTTLIDTRAIEASPFAMNKINTAILRAATGIPAKKINVVISPFLKTAGAKAIDDVYSGTVYAFVFAIGMSFIPASLITFIVKEREVNSKHQQIVSGVSITAYWFSNFFVDFIKYLFVGIINALLAMAFNATTIIAGEKLGGCWAIFLLYGIAIIPFVYLIAFLFRDYGTAQIASFFFNFGTGFIGGLAIAILRLFESTRPVGSVLQWILRPLPTFTMTYGFLNLANREVDAMIDDLDAPRPVFDLALVGADVLYLCVTSVVYFILVFVVEHLKNKQSLNTILTRETTIPYEPKKLDDDVEREMREIENSDKNAYAIKVDKLRKVYSLGGGKHKVAVDRLSFGVKNGECFALLGVNGAGKTTTFKILSGDYVQTSGKAYINGYEIPQEIAQARQNIGYCPQFDSILELLTAKEHLYLYAAIKGIPVSMRDRIVEKHLREMNLKQYENIPAGTYSGGNKRKLCVAIAMIGNPAVVFLDEPSTGMDPEARRFMWNIISRISRERKQSSIILTTHSMEEAEALATKMGIMVNGNLKCLGTSQHIKSKYGGGHEIEIKLELPPKELLTETMQSLNCDSAHSIEKHKVDEILEKLGAGHLKKEISENGSGSAIYMELKKGSTSANLLIEWILMEKSGERLKKFLNENLGEMKIIEHFSTFYRFKTTHSISVGKFFGCLEENKTAMNILQYSIKQGTIEQIFNSFAAEDAQIQEQKEIETAIPIIKKPEEKKEEIAIPISK